MTTLTDLQASEGILDTDYTSTDTVILASKLNQNINELYLHLYPNNQKSIQTSS
jgi:hypothetical protein